MKRALLAVALFATPLLAAPAQACEFRYCAWGAPVCAVNPGFPLCHSTVKEIACDYAGRPDPAC